MGIWSKLFRWGREAPDAVEEDEAEQDSETTPAEERSKTVELPVEPFVFECQSCGKVFEARRKHPVCPECDSPDVSLVSE